MSTIVLGRRNKLNGSKEYLQPPGKEPRFGPRETAARFPELESAAFEAAKRELSAANAPANPLLEPQFTWFDEPV